MRRLLKLLPGKSALEQLSEREQESLALADRLAARLREQESLRQPSLRRSLQEWGAMITEDRPRRA
jgi:hypothetical protein